MILVKCMLIYIRFEQLIKYFPEHSFNWIIPYASTSTNKLSLLYPYKYINIAIIVYPELLKPNSNMYFGIELPGSFDNILNLEGKEESGLLIIDVY